MNTQTRNSTYTPNKRNVTIYTSSLGRIKVATAGIQSYEIQVFKIYTPKQPRQTQKKRKRENKRGNGEQAAERRDREKIGFDIMTFERCYCCCWSCCHAASCLTRSFARSMRYKIHGRAHTNTNTRRMSYLASRSVCILHYSLSQSFQQTFLILGPCLCFERHTIGCLTQLTMMILLRCIVVNERASVCVRGYAYACLDRFVSFHHFRSQYTLFWCDCLPLTHTHMNNHLWCYLEEQNAERKRVTVARRKRHST